MLLAVLVVYLFLSCLITSLSATSEFTPGACTADSNMMHSDWFKRLFGFSESRAAIERHIQLNGTQLHSTANGRTFTAGNLEVVTLRDLRVRADEVRLQLPGKISVREVVEDAGELHANSANAGALFQVASQFNLLEMVSPNVTPDDGITGYVLDRTQGPACAVACGAGTLKRNWFSQSTSEQIDTLAGVGEELGNSDEQYWKMVNGYALLTGKLPKLADWPDVSDALAIGLHTDTEVTLFNARHLVSQAYCSALPISYSPVTLTQGEPLVRLVLNSAYEATFAAAVLNAVRTGNRSVYLTLLGGGVFGNPTKWIVDAIDRAIRLYSDVGLDIVVVSYRRSNPALSRIIT